MIRVTDLSKRFPLPGGGGAVGSAWVTAVENVSFAVAAGEVYGLLGPNGAGKTTTLRMVLGLMTPDGGDAAVAGVSVRADPAAAKRNLGLVSALAGVYPSLTVRELLSYFADVYGVPPALAGRRVGELAERFGVADLLGRRCGSLSTGQRQRVHLARALIHDPPALLLDEPTTGVDVLGSQAVVEYVELLRDQGKAVILSTHRMEEAERLCSRVGLLHRGRLVLEGTLDQLRAATGKGSLTEMFLAQVGMDRLLAAPAEDAA